MNWNQMGSEMGETPHLGADHPGPLISDVLQRGGDVDLFNACRKTGSGLGF